MSDNTADFSKFLDRDGTEFKKAPPLPIGTYTFAIQGMDLGKSEKKGTPFVRFKVKPISAEPDVDADELRAATSTKALGDRELRLDFYLTETAAYRLTEFLKLLDIDVNRPVKKALEEVGGRFFKGYVVQEVSQKPGSEDVFNNISKTLAA